jgi:hypothetical protein
METGRIWDLGADGLFVPPLRDNGKTDAERKVVTCWVRTTIKNLITDMCKRCLVFDIGHSHGHGLGAGILRSRECGVGYRIHVRFTFNHVQSSAWGDSLTLVMYVARGGCGPVVVNSAILPYLGRAGGVVVRAVRHLRRGCIPQSRRKRLPKLNVVGKSLLVSFMHVGRGSHLSVQR